MSKATLIYTISEITIYVYCLINIKINILEPTQTKNLDELIISEINKYFYFYIVRFTFKNKCNLNHFELYF